MADRAGIFAGDNPFVLMAQWLAEAENSEPNDANAMALATVDQDGLPNNRMVLLKGIETETVVFYTNYHSAKGQELAAIPKAALVLHWKSLRRQIRMRGRVTQLVGAQADDYFNSRSLLSRIGARASVQSQVITDRATLQARIEAVRKAYGKNPPRPDFWGGYRVHPSEIEFWADGAGRLHDRFRWRKAGTGWQIDRLSP